MIDCSGRGECSWECSWCGDRESSRAMGLWCDAGRKAELTAENSKLGLTLTKPLSKSVLMTGVRRVKSNGFFDVVFCFVLFFMQPFALILTQRYNGSQWQDWKKKQYHYRLSLAAIVSKDCVYSGKQQSELPPLRNCFLKRKQFRNSQSYQIALCNELHRLYVRGRYYLIWLKLAECCP